jgi:hypothetical protein
MHMMKKHEKSEVSKTFDQTKFVMTTGFSQLPLDVRIAARVRRFLGVVGDDDDDGDGQDAHDE